MRRFATIQASEIMEMFSHLIDEYHRASHALKMAIESADDAAVEAADGRLAQCWKKLLAATPVGPVEARSLVEFLLQEISRLQAFGEFEKAAAEKILSVFESLVPGK